MQLPLASDIARSRAVSLASGVVLAVLWGLFSVSHLQKFLVTWEIATLLLVIAETLGAALYLLRSDPATVSTRPLDWLVAVLGTFAVLLFRPSDYGVMPGAGYIMLVGLILLIFGLVSLNRSFALVAANRKIKTSRMYKVVRHPIYASYCVIFGAYVMQNTTAYNFAVYVVLMFLLVARISSEEKHLMQDPVYRTYAEGTRYRLIPFIY